MLVIKKLIKMYPHDGGGRGLVVFSFLFFSFLFFFLLNQVFNSSFNSFAVVSTYLALEANNFGVNGL